MPKEKPSYKAAVSCKCADTMATLMKDAQDLVYAARGLQAARKIVGTAVVPKDDYEAYGFIIEDFERAMGDLQTDCGFIEAPLLSIQLERLKGSMGAGMYDKAEDEADEIVMILQRITEPCIEPKK